MTNFVRDDGSIRARFILVGEAPGKYENTSRIPFVGPSGYKLKEWWKEVGLQRTDFYLTNVYPYWPELTPYKHIEGVPTDELNYWIEQLHARLALLEDPWLIIPTGNVATRALMNRDPRDRTIKINNYRGSIMPYIDRRQRCIKMIPTIHPASIFHAKNKSETGNPGRIEKHCRLDWRRIAYEGTFRELNLPQAEHFTRPTFSDMEWYCKEVEDRARVMSIDIETPFKSIGCVGFSFEPNFSFTIPFRDPRYFADPADQEWAKHFITRLCHAPCEKVLQNGTFDQFWFWMAEQIWLFNYKWDTKFMHHCFDPVDDHDLGYLKSVFLRGQFHKDEAKDPEKMARYASDFDALQTYCGMDNTTQRALFDVFHAELTRRDLLQFYLEHYAELIPALIEMMMGGIRTDGHRRKWQQALLQVDLLHLQTQVTEAAGVRLHAGPKAFSNKRLAQWLYQTQGLPAQRERGKETLTTKEVALRRLQLRYPQRCAAVIVPVLEVRRKAKLMEHLDDNKTDADGRMRCEYSPTTEQARLSSKKNPWGTGRNLQNVDHDVKSTYLADENQVLVGLDLSQAEARSSFIYSGDPQLIDLARRHPADYDGHTQTAMLIFELPQEEITYEHRQIGKKTVHGAWRGLGGDKLSGVLLNEGFVRTPEECDDYLRRYRYNLPGIQYYFNWVVQQVLRYQKLVNSWGRVWDVSFERMNDDLFRRAYSDLPQSEVADITNMWGVKPARTLLHEQMQYKHGRLVAQTHDEVLMSLCADAAYDVVAYLCSLLERPRIYHTRSGELELRQFTEIKMGRDWAGSKTWKRLPPQHEFDAAVQAELSGEADRGAVAVWAQTV